MPAKLAIGVVGAGAIGRLHAEKIAGSDFCALAGIADPAEAGKAFAETLGVPWFSSHHEMLEKAKLAAAVVATPNSTHRPIGADFLERGVAVLIEKPIASTVADGLAIAAASRRTGVPVLVGHHRRHNPIVARARDCVASGALGRLTTATVLSGFYKHQDYFNLEWRRVAGGGPILINLIHEIDLVRHLCGEIASVQAMASNGVRGFEVEDSAVIIARLVNGALVTISLSDTVAAPWSWDLSSGELANYPPQPSRVNSHFLCGTEGSITLPQLEHWSYKGTRSWFAPLTREELDCRRGDPYVAQLRNLCAIARGEAAPLISAEDGTRTLRATLAASEAARTGRAVNLEE